MNVKNLCTDMENIISQSKTAMGIDYGTKKTGIAIADNKLKASFPITTIKTKNTGILIEQIRHLILKYNVGLLVLGTPNPEHYDDSIYLQLSVLLKEQTLLPVYLQDEYYTSKAVREILSNVGFRKRKIDQIDDPVAAKLILDDFLEKWTYLKTKIE